MAGTILAKLSSTAQADNTTITPANSGFTSVTIPAGSTAVHLAAAKMGEAEGYQFTQTTTAVPIAYLDFTPQTIFAFRFPYRYSTTPSVKGTIYRTYSDTSHATTRWSMGHSSTNRLDVVEAGGSLNILSPSGTPLVPNTDYVIMGLENVGTNTITVKCFPRGSATDLFGGALTGATSLTSSVSAIRTGIGTSSSIPQIWTNDAFAVGYGDYLDRTDLVSSPLSASVVVVPNSGAAPLGVTATCTATGGTGTTKTYAWNWGDGSTTAASTSTSATHTFTVAGTYTVTCTVANL